jgi:cytochrome c
VRDLVIGVGCAFVLIGAGAADSRAQGIANPGERTFSFCFSCHSVDPNEAATLQGPNLAGIVGRPIASKPGFEYSPAIKSFAAGGKVWTPELILQFIQDPQALIPDTAMQRPPGPRKEADRAALIDYLKNAH